MKIRLLLGVLLIALAITVPASASLELKERVIERLPSEKDEPILITAIMVNNEMVALNKQF